MWLVYSFIKCNPVQQLCNEYHPRRQHFVQTWFKRFPSFMTMCLHVCTQKMYVASPYTDPVIAPDSDPQPLDAGDGLIWVVGPVLAVVFIICIVIAILLYKK